MKPDSIFMLFFSWYYSVLKKWSWSDEFIYSRVVLIIFVIPVLYLGSIVNILRSETSYLDGISYYWWGIPLGLLILYLGSFKRRNTNFWNEVKSRANEPILRKHKTLFVMFLILTFGLFVFSFMLV